MPQRRKDGYIRTSFSFRGKRYYIYGKTKTELFEKEKQKREELEQHYDSKLNPSLQQYYQKWKERRIGTVGEATIRSNDITFKMISDVYIKEMQRNFDELLIKDITVDDLYFLQRTIAADKSTKTTNDCVTFVKRLLNSAEQERIIMYNPGKMVKNLKRTEEEVRDTKHRALTHEEQDKFFKDVNVKSSYYYDAFRFAILTGMRVGEIGALKMSDIDIKSGFITVQRTLTVDINGTIIVGQNAKTKAGKRSIPISDGLKAVIADIKQKRSAVNEGIINFDDIIFKTKCGKYLAARDPDRELKRLCGLLGIEPFTMHGLRATFATRCIENNMNPKTLQEILGHKNFNLTMSLYAHVLEDTKKQEMSNVIIAI